MIMPKMECNYRTVCNFLEFKIIEAERASEQAMAVEDYELEVGDDRNALIRAGEQTRYWMTYIDALESLIEDFQMEFGGRRNDD